MMEARDERERYVTNPLRLIRAFADLAMRPVIAGSDAIDAVEWSRFTDYEVESPCDDEEDLLQGYLF